MINVNGVVLTDQLATVEINNRGFLFGDLVFESFRVINSRIIFWEDHYFRLMASMRIMRMEIPQSFSSEFLEQEVLGLISKNDLENFPVRVRINIFRKPGGLYFPDNMEIGYTISIEKLNSAFYLLNENPYEIEIFKDHYVNSGLLSTIKTNNKATNVLGGIFAMENGYNNCLLVNEHKNVIEALNANLFLVSGSNIKTPPLSEGCLNGIIRKKIIDLVKKLPDYSIVESPISPFELQKADETFFTNAIMGIQPVSKFRKKSYNNSVAKDLLGKLNAQARLAN